MEHDGPKSTNGVAVATAEPLGRLDEEDFDVALANACSDLVSVKANEPFPRALLTGKRAGEWAGVCDLCRDVRLAADGWKSDLFATWLPDPLALDGYVVIVFYDDESKWSMTAHYNRARLVGAVGDE